MTAKLPPYGSEAMIKLLAEYEFDSVLDVGCGPGHAARCFVEAGKKVTAIDKRDCGGIDGVENYIVEDFNEIEWQGVRPFPCVWCCHVLEHQENVGRFLFHLRHCVQPGGILAITVPPLKQSIVQGHVSLWNPGLLLYRLALVGFDCRNASLKCYGYNISVLVRNGMRQITTESNREEMKTVLPGGLDWHDSRWEFDGEIREINW